MTLRLENWTDYFREMGFGNAANIRGTKRVELFDLIYELMELQRQSTIEDFRRFVEQCRIDSNRFDYDDALDFIGQHSPAPESNKEEK